MYFCFCSFFHSFGSFNHADSTSLSFSEFSGLFSSILLLSQRQKVILHFHLPGVTSDIIMSVLHESSMFFGSLCIVDVVKVSFHHASLWFLRVPHCSTLGLVLRLVYHLIVVSTCFRCLELQVCLLSSPRYSFLSLNPNPNLHLNRIFDFSIVFSNRISVRDITVLTLWTCKSVQVLFNL